MRWAQEQRLAFILQRILAGETINRRDLMDKFKISLPQASTDLNLFKEKHPVAMRYDATRKAYVPNKITIAPSRIHTPD